MERSLLRVKSKRMKQLTYEEAQYIYNQWRSGHYYQKEILEEHRISRRTLENIINYFKGVVNGR